MNLHFNNLVDNIYIFLFEVKVNNKLTMVLLIKKRKKRVNHGLPAFGNFLYPLKDLSLWPHQ